jgi:hypothetical protein
MSCIHLGRRCLSTAKSGKASIYGLFGGQGTNEEVYFAELKALYHTYKPYVAELVTRITKAVLIPAADKATNVEGVTYYSHGPDVLSWLEDPAEFTTVYTWEPAFIQSTTGAVRKLATLDSPLLFTSTLIVKVLPSFPKC